MSRCASNGPLFKLSPPPIELRLIVPPPTSSPALQVIFHHFSTLSLSIATSLPSSFSHPPPPIFSISILPWSSHRQRPVSLSFTIFPLSYLHLHQAIALPFFGFRRCLCTPKLKNTQSALLVHVSVSCLCFPSSSIFLLPPSQSNFLPSPSLCVSPQAANGE